MDIHQADLPAKESAAFSSLEKCLYPAFIFQGSIHQTGSIRTFQVMFNEILVEQGLFFGEDLTDDTPFHRQDAVMDIGLIIDGMQQQADAAILFNQAISCNNPVLYQVLIEIGPDPLTDLLQLTGFYCISGEPVNHAVLIKCLVIHFNRPAGDHSPRQFLADRLKGIIPVTTAKGDQGGARNE